MKFPKAILILAATTVFLFVSAEILAQDWEDCQSLEECQALLDEYEQESQRHEQNIVRTQKEEQSYQNTIYILRKKIQSLEAQIEKGNVIIRDLKVQIGDTQVSIEKTSQKIEKSKTQLAGILREIYAQDQRGSLEVLLSGEDIADFFDNLIALEGLSQKNQEVLQSIKNLKAELQIQEQTLSEEKQDWQKTVEIQILQKEQSRRTKTEQQWLLEKTKGEEEAYQKLLAETQEKARRIRERIFDLVGVPDAPTFGEALEIARYIEQITGVRAALLLAVLTQESNIGKNVGQCYLKDPDTGEGIAIRTGKKISRVMKPTRDVAPFLRITQALGKDSYNTLVSCPMSFGWGGAMGPAQFIPSTWALYEDKFAQIIGKAADPWNIKDAFLAAGVLLKDAGAAQQTADAEWRAAMIYFSGGTSLKYRFYGDSVVALAESYQKDIETLETF